VTPLSEQIAAAERFLRIARFHQDNPRPERLEQALQELLEVLRPIDIPLEDAA
jgi:penicillin V acylase-like amidase (Ntn superfamily)